MKFDYSKILSIASPSVLSSKLERYFSVIAKLECPNALLMSYKGTPLVLAISDDLAIKDEKLNSTEIMKNEFGERCFVFNGPLGCTWHIIEKKKTKNTPVKDLKFELVKE